MMPTRRSLLVAVVLPMLLIASIGTADERSFRTFLGEQATVEATGFTFGRIPPGSYAIDGVLELGAQLGHDSDLSWWHVDLYSVSFDIDANGKFHEPDDAIFETMPWPNVLETFPEFEPAPELVELDLERERLLRPTLTDAEIEKLLNPVPRLYAAVDGTWELYGGQTLSHLDTPTASRRGVIASGTFVGDYGSPVSFTQTDGLGPGFLVGGPFELDFVELLPGDIDKNRVVDFVDFVAFTSAFGRACDDCREDLNKDGWVGFHDFLVLGENLGESLVRGSAAVPVPEPAVGWLLLSLLTYAAMRHRRHRH